MFFKYPIPSLIKFINRWQDWRKFGRRKTLLPEIHSDSTSVAPLKAMSATARLNNFIALRADFDFIAAFFTAISVV